jgi:putative toxin-antitoxin system antitoxin component (TIGR02293 family)
MGVVSSRRARYAAALSKAASVLGSQEAAEQWMREPAMGLNRQVPAKLVGTVAGAALVDTFLDQLEYGVYV